MQVKKQQLEPDMEQQTGSKLGKEYIKAVCCHPAYLTYMPSTCEFSQPYGNYVYVFVELRNCFPKWLLHFTFPYVP